MKTMEPLSVTVFILST